MQENSTEVDMREVNAKQDSPDKHDTADLATESKTSVGDIKTETSDIESPSTG